MAFNYRFISCVLFLLISAWCDGAKLSMVKELKFQAPLMHDLPHSLKHIFKIPLQFGALFCELSTCPALLLLCKCCCCSTALWMFPQLSACSALISLTAPSTCRLWVLSQRPVWASLQDYLCCCREVRAQTSNVNFTAEFLASGYKRQSICQSSPNLRLKKSFWVFYPFWSCTYNNLRHLSNAAERRALNPAETETLDSLFVLKLSSGVVRYVKLSAHRANKK